MEKIARYLWLDIAKGIAIILMVLGHTSIPHELSNFIWAFHMPLFFIASGYTTNWGKRSFMQFILHKTKTIILPFVIYSVILLLLTQESSESVTMLFLIRNGWISWALWFIPVLFFATVLGKLLFSVRNKSFMTILVMCLLLVGIMLSYNKIYLPWSLSTVPVATIFVIVGTKLRQYNNIITNSQWWQILLLLIVTALISYFWRLDLCFNKILPFIPLFCGAIVGTILIFKISVLIVRYISFLAEILGFIGRETYIIVAFSQIIIVLLNDYFLLNIFVKYILFIFIMGIILYIKSLIKRIVNTIKH